MARALAYSLGIHLPKNFSHPYYAKSLIDFWRRWHITLSTWLRDYLYIPLGGSNCSNLRKNLNLFITMVLGGLWHGASFNFILWGAIHGFGLIVNHKTKNMYTSLKFRVLSRITLLPFIIFTFTIFRIESIQDLVIINNKIFYDSTGGAANTIVFLITFITYFSIQCIKYYLPINKIYH